MLALVAWAILTERPNSTPLKLTPPMELELLKGPVRQAAMLLKTAMMTAARYLFVWHEGPLQPRRSLESPS
ncbi:hypothetical protein D3C85_1833510 [compost metagenome]